MSELLGRCGASLQQPAGQPSPGLAPAGGSAGPSSQLLGWLSYRPLTNAAGGGASAASGSLRPSAREAAVTEALLRALLGPSHPPQLALSGQQQPSQVAGGQQEAGPAWPLLFLLVGLGRGHNGATLTWSYRRVRAGL